MCDDHSNALANFPSSLEEALDFAIEVPFPHFESTVNIQDGFDISHDPPVLSLVEGDMEDSISETSDSILNPPPSFFLYWGFFRRGSFLWIRWLLPYRFGQRRITFPFPRFLCQRYGPKFLFDKFSNSSISILPIF